VGAIRVEHKPGFRNCVEQQTFRKYGHLKKNHFFTKYNNTVGSA